MYFEKIKRDDFDFRKLPITWGISHYHDKTDTWIIAPIPFNLIFRYFFKILWWLKVGSLDPKFLYLVRQESIEREVSTHKRNKKLMEDNEIIMEKQKSQLDRVQRQMDRDEKIEAENKKNVG